MMQAHVFVDLVLCSFQGLHEFLVKFPKNL